MLTYLILCGGLLGLFLGGDLLVRGASAIAVRLGMSPMVIGLTIVGFGTSTPELLVSLNAALNGQSGIAIGNVVGSNIANLLLILGLAALIAPVESRFQDNRGDLFWMCGAVIILPVLFYSGHIGRIEGFVLALGLVSYLVLRLRGARDGELTVDAAPLWRSLLITALGLAAVMAGAHYLVQSATIIARDWGVSEAMIGLSIVAIGTSLPELATTCVAAFRGQRDIALGNVIGSNIFNVLGILGITALIAPIPVDARFLTLDTPFVIAVSLIILALIAWRNGFGRIVGLAMLATYAGYIAYSAMI
ncbi:cation:H+ antiporter [Cognatiyoonia koreensis]|uniref:Cation:H+ antiporter n=1 Tax=Cognatiyoonia koreensis TaxID=364200 RepID=A0A1I0NTP2_9RHOB|nr:calcium/sodium antiporter [Cognatiyoonia koreensis]SEW05071.1 cation:H+ antiporter [Cognatiyoonia koreensis]